MKVLVVALLGFVLLAGVAFADNMDEPEEPESEEVPCPEVEECPGEYEEYNCCGKCFQKTCISKNVKCEVECTKGCYCMEGFVREYEGGKCMPERFCQAYLRKGFGSG
uniref:TIL domain-containing protein n=1 Tax=Anopheles funestus TaxID=62324 RepID=A0A4Y0BPB3_ANOFN